MEKLNSYLNSIGVDISSASIAKNAGKRVLLGMSGGVDSSVAAVILLAQGYKVVSGFMRNWVELDSRGVCTSEADYQDVISVSELLGIPYYSFDFSKEYYERVFKQFISDYKDGLTPNPDIFCNKEIKFDCFYKLKKQLNFDYIATGHYCSKVMSNGKFSLAKGKDLKKDQSYFLSGISGDVLESVLFPLGNLEKTQIREIAKIMNLTNKDKKDSTGVCFIGERNFKNFLMEYIQSTKGSFKTLDEKIVGEHEGSCFYTLGQRKGLGLGGPGDPWYVVDKDHQDNTVYVARDHDHPRLFKKEVIINDLHWIQGPPKKTKLKAKIRYRQSDQDCILDFDKGKKRVIFHEAQRAVCPRQIVAFYDGEICLGSGVIQIA